MMKAKLVGNWSGVRNALAQSNQLKQAINKAALQEAHDARRDMIKGITQQAPGGRSFQALSAITLAIRKARGFRGKKVLLVTAGLRNSITVKQMGSGKIYVGVLRSARSKDGRSMINVARMQELGGTVVIRVTPKMKKWLMIQLRKAGFGSREKRRGKDGRKLKSRFVPSGRGQLASGVLVIKIPARPFMQPIIDNIARNPGALRKRMAERIAREMKMILGEP